MIAAPPTESLLQPLAFVPPVHDWRALLAWIRASPPPATLPRGRPPEPAQGPEPAWIKIPREALIIPRWTLTWDPEAGLVGTRWIPASAAHGCQLTRQVVLGPADWTSVWTVQLASHAPPHSLWGLWWPPWQQRLAVVCLDRAQPEPYGPHPRLTGDRLLAAPDQAQQWAQFLLRRGWVTPAEWPIWTAPLDPAAVTRYPVVLW